MIDWDQVVIGPTVAVFGEAITYLPAAGGSLSITGVFDEAYSDVDLAGGTAVTTDSPVLGVQLSQFPATPAQGDQLTVMRTATTYVIREVRPDGHGSARLLLNEVSP